MKCLCVIELDITPQEFNGKPGYRVLYPNGYESWRPAYLVEKFGFVCALDDVISDEDVIRLNADFMSVDEMKASLQFVRQWARKGWKSFNAEYMREEHDRRKRRLPARPAGKNRKNFR